MSVLAMQNALGHLGHESGREDTTPTETLASCSDSAWAGDPWTPQLAPGVFDPCHVQEKEINDIFRQARSPHPLSQQQWQQQQLGATRVQGKEFRNLCPAVTSCCRLSPARQKVLPRKTSAHSCRTTAELPLQSPSHAVYLASLLSSASRADRLLCPHSTSWKLFLWIGATQSKIIHEKFIAILCCSSSDLWL